MKKILLTIVVLLTLSLLGGCGQPQEGSPITPEPSTPSAEAPAEPAPESEPAEPATPPSAESDPAEPVTSPLEEPEEETEPEGDASSDSIDTIYNEQIERYFTAIAEQWDESTYFDCEMSALAAYYYEGSALDNIGFTVMDLDRDNSKELIIGAIKNAELDPLVFEIWTIKNGEPAMLAQSGSRNRYYMQYEEENDLWSVAYEAENGAANHAVYYLQLTNGEFAVTQGIIFDALANESEPWFMAYDLDWDVSNDTPIDEDTANAVMDAGRKLYTAIEYLPYSQYKNER